MNKLWLFLLSTLPVVSSPLFAQNVMEHEGVGFTYEEVEQVVSRWKPDMQEAAANDPGDRLELLNNALIAKKLELQARSVKREENPELYWQIQFKTRTLYRDMMMKEFRRNLELPDLDALAKERYKVEKERFAYVPEHRITSHILLRCSGDACNDELRAKAETIAQKARAGESFADLAKEYSDDPGSKDKGGRFDRWLRADDTGVAAEYVEAVYALENPGDISDVMQSQFGYHVIRFDEVRDPHFLEYKKVAADIKKLLEKEYRRDATSAYVRSLNMDDSAVIDGKAMEKIFSSYKAPSGSK